VLACAQGSVTCKGRRTLLDTQQANSHSHAEDGAQALKEHGVHGHLLGPAGALLLSLPCRRLAGDIAHELPLLGLRCLDEAAYLCSALHAAQDEADLLALASRVCMCVASLVRLSSSSVAMSQHSVAMSQQQQEGMA
jgi:hypothetical protein